jgi:hypothetical protein
MGFFLFSDNSIYRAVAGTYTAAVANFFNDFVGKQSFTAFGRAFFMMNVGFVFVPEVLQSG